ncbi:MAG: lauroyl acyltransferase [Alphaproteobacteria bacterium]|nr:lauroyl acyltransferase [Alphaproteobacteria bacterium]MDX5415261.1 lauroyl acyltransferase [Alphaproteobacteria bacterium]MDX5492470.1 lauroyl acyltransferase [Alphaproteobacteria bacterium]
MKYLAEFAALRFALGFFGAMPVDRASAVGGWLGRTVGPKVGVSKKARRNIGLAMPGLSPAEADRIITGMWDNLGRTIAEYAHLPVFARPEERHRIEVVHAGLLRSIAASGNGGVIVSGHFANWEMLPAVMQFEGLDGGGVYRHANNPYVNDWLVRLRQKITQAVQIPKGAAGARLIVRLMMEKKFVAMLTDQKLNDGIETTFFGLRAMTTGAPAGLATRYDDPIIPVFIERLEGAHFRVTVYDPIVAQRDADPAAEVLRITQEINDFLEARIRERPEQWLWLHDRWSEKQWTQRKKLAQRG